MTAAVSTIHLLLLHLQVINCYVLELHTNQVRVHISRKWFPRIQYFMYQVVARDPCMTEQERVIYHTLAVEFYLALFMR